MEFTTPGGPNRTERVILQGASKADAQRFVDGLGGRFVKQGPMGLHYRAGKRRFRIDRSSFIGGSYEVLEMVDVQ